MYSGLRFLIEERGITIADLARRVASRGEAVDIRTWRRLANPDRPFKLVDTRVLDAVCRALGVDFGELLVFVPTLGADLRHLPEARHRRLSAPLDAHADGELAPDERRELETPVAEADDRDFANARRLVEHRDPVRAGIRPRAQRGGLTMPRVPAADRRLVKRRADERCEYCHAPQLVANRPFHIEQPPEGYAARAATAAQTAPSTSCNAGNLAKNVRNGVPDPPGAGSTPLLHPQ